MSQGTGRDSSASRRWLINGARWLLTCPAVRMVTVSDTARRRPVNALRLAVGESGPAELTGWWLTRSIEALMVRTAIGARAER
jgi:hypothetical protein